MSITLFTLTMYGASHTCHSSMNNELHYIVAMTKKKISIAHIVSSLIIDQTCLHLKYVSLKQAWNVILTWNKIQSNLRSIVLRKRLYNGQALSLDTRFLSLEEK